jgi:hypothetical protein
MECVYDDVLYSSNGFTSNEITAMKLHHHIKKNVLLFRALNQGVSLLDSEPFQVLCHL